MCSWSTATCRCSTPRRCAELIETHRSGRRGGDHPLVVPGRRHRLRPHRAHRGRAPRPHRRAQGCDRRRARASARSTPASTSSALSALRDQLAALDDRQRAGREVPHRRDRAAARRRASTSTPLPVAESWLVEGINDRAQLSEAAAKLNALIVRTWQLAGVTVQDPATTWIDVKAKLAPDVDDAARHPAPRRDRRSRTGATIGPDTTLARLRGRRGRPRQPHRRDPLRHRRRRDRRAVRLPAARHRPRRRRQDRHLRRDQERGDRRGHEARPLQLRRRRRGRREVATSAPA